MWSTRSEVRDPRSANMRRPELKKRSRHTKAWRWSKRKPGTEQRTWVSSLTVRSDEITRPLLVSGPCPRGPFCASYLLSSSHHLVVCAISRPCSLKTHLHPPHCSIHPCTLPWARDHQSSHTVPHRRARSAQCSVMYRSTLSPWKASYTRRPSFQPSEHNFRHDSKTTVNLSDHRHE
jgi:hypothetical protein